MKLRIDPSRPLERLIGDNYGIIRMRCGRIHCCTPFMDAVRQIRPKSVRSVPPALRRGLILCIAETLAAYRDEYVAVMSGNLGGE